jgi:hypothetical protein
MIFINRRNNRNNNNREASNGPFNPVSVMPIVTINPPIKQIDPPKPIKKERVKEMLWGEPTWFLFHTLAEKIKDEYFVQLKNELVSFIKQICNNLPCPDCAQHATRFMNGVNFDAILNKTQLKVFFYNFHNELNRRKEYDVFEFPDIEKYKNAVTINIVKNFLYHFGKKSYSVRLDVNSHHRSLLLKNFRVWLEQYYYCFEE